MLLVGEACNGTAVVGSTEFLFASAVSQLRTAAERLKVLTELVLNLLQQLGALCSEQTRKSTVISGTPSQANLPNTVSGSSSVAHLPLRFQLMIPLGAADDHMAEYAKRLF